MYTEYFGLEQEPFRAGFEGPGIYVGERQATVIARLEKALAKPDAVVTVTGPVGVGKTTLVSRALEVTLPQGRVARIGRMRLGPDEVVELLLTEFGVSRQPRGTIQRFAAFKRLLDECADDGTPAVIVVEDSRRLGIDALIELEAMTAADGGNSACANLLLMGDPQLPAFLAEPLLARLAQRIRTRQALRPFGVDELRDYLKHCLHLAGGELDAIFESGSVSMLHQCSDGIPRIVNNICETALSEAADAGAHRVTVELLRDIARDVYAIDTLPPELLDPDAGEDDLEQDEEFFSAGEFEPEPDTPVDEEATVAEQAVHELPADEDEELTISEFTPKPAITIVDRPRAAAVTPPDLPASREEREGRAFAGQWQDRTGTDLTPVATAAGEQSANEPHDVEETLDSDADTHEVPVLDNTAAVLKLDAESGELRDDDIPVPAESTGGTSPAAEADDEAPRELEARRDESAIDTLTPEAEELTAALDELELAISSANEPEPSVRDAPEDDAGAAREPELTLDENPERPGPSADELSRWQEELANAKSLEEMSDMLAETVFGDQEFDRVAAEVTANPPADGSTTAGDAAVHFEPEVEPARPSRPETGAAPPGDSSQCNQGETGGFDMPMTKRFDLLRSLDEASPDHGDVEITLGEEDSSAGSSGDSPETIESQIDTAITQSRTQLKSADIEKLRRQEAPVDEEGEKESTGFFGLFKRSSKS